jgi:AcrR family transcriptional regulator
MSAESSAPRPLTKDRVLRAALALADEHGIGALTMRRLGTELGVEAMALYKHVANKDEILDGIVELVVGEVELPAEGADWRAAMRMRAESARHVLGRHSWAIGLLESRGSMGPATARYLNAILGSLRGAGFSIEGAVHAFWLIDCFVYGHVIQEANLPFASSSEAGASLAAAPREVTDEFPNLAEVMEHARTSEYSVDTEFEYGMDLILDALERSASPGQ